MKNHLINLTIFYFIFFNSVLLSVVNAFNCDLPEHCRLDLVDDVFTNLLVYEKSYYKRQTIWCDIKENNFEFRFKEPTINQTNCDQIDPNYYNIYALKWTISNELAILNNRFNFSNAVRYFKRVPGDLSYISFIGLNGFDVNFLNNELLIKNYSQTYYFQFLNGRLDFYHKNKKLSSCQDIIDLNLTRFKSIFQIQFLHEDGYVLVHGIQLKNMEYKQSICPLVFANARLISLSLYDLVDTFYKKNVLSFTNETFPTLDSTVLKIDFKKVQNINLDMNLIHESVFKYVGVLNIVTINALNSIEGEIFKRLNSLRTLSFLPETFRKINHKQGIKWMTTKLWC